MGVGTIYKTLKRKFPTIVTIDSIIARMMPKEESMRLKVVLCLLVLLLSAAVFAQQDDPFDLVTATQNDLEQHLDGLNADEIVAFIGELDEPAEVELFFDRLSDNAFLNLIETVSVDEDAEAALLDFIYGIEDRVYFSFVAGVEDERVLQMMGFESTDDYVAFLEDEGGNVLDILNPDDVAELLVEVGDDLEVVLLDALDAESLEDYLAELDTDSITKLLDDLDTDGLNNLIDSVDTQALTDLLAEVDTDEIVTVLERIGTEDIPEILNALETDVLDEVVNEIENSEVLNAMLELDDEDIRAALEDLGITEDLPGEIGDQVSEELNNLGSLLGGDSDSENEEEAESTPQADESGE